METQHFEIPTRDGRTRLTGQVDLPSGDGAARHPAVLIVPGGWFMDRDGYMGGSGTERDLIYRDLAKDIVAAGIAVVRYDNRGVRCNEMTMPPCRYAEHVMGWDADGDGRVREADVERQLPTDPLFAAVGMSREVLTPPAEGWTLESVRARFAGEYEAMKAAALARPDDAPYLDPAPEFRLVAASNNWWKRWFEDTTPMIDHLASYLGCASFHIGGIDSQHSGERQRAFAESRIKAGIFARPPRLVFHKGRGHSLRTGEPAAGPMDDEVKACLVKEIEEMLSAE
jgi:hypothetical protein